MTDTTISKSIFLSAAREIVWQFLTDKDKLGLWFHPAESNLIEGQDFALVKTEDDGSTTKMCWGTVTAMNEPSSLTYTFTIKPFGGTMTTVTWTLEEILGGTKLSLKHVGLGEAAGDAAMGLLLALDGGWDKHLTALRSASA